MESWDKTHLSTHYRRVLPGSFDGEFCRRIRPITFFCPAQTVVVTGALEILTGQNEWYILRHGMVMRARKTRGIESCYHTLPAYDPGVAGTLPPGF